MTAGRTRSSRHLCRDPWGRHGKARFSALSSWLLAGHACPGIWTTDFGYAWRWGTFRPQRPLVLWCIANLRFLKTAGRSHLVPASVSRSLGVRLAVRDFPPSVVGYRPDPRDPRHLCHDPTSDTPGGVLSALSGLSFSAASRTYELSIGTAGRTRRSGIRSPPTSESRWRSAFRPQ